MSNKKSSKAKSKSRAVRQKRLILLACIFAALIIGIGVIHFIRPDHTINAQPSDVIDDGLIRVSLRSLGNPKALGLTLDGVYTVDGDAGFRFARGTEISVAEDAGKLYLSAGGLTIDMGGGFTLKRHAPEAGADAGGIFIHESEKNNLFAGDLKLSSNAGGIESILTVQVEDYLYGVVAYEMNDSFPIEALKAQAIAARTYAMRAKAQNKSKAYDVVDTTQDQVYKGYDDKLTQIIKAVDTTRGIVGMSDGTYAQCYYTASNGGQIASTKQVWGGSVSYIEMKDDPYDLENSLSVEKSAFVPKDLTEGSALERALAEQVLPYVPDAYVLRADTIVNVSLSDPDVTGSLMYKTLTFEVAVSERTVIETEPSAGDDIDTATPSEAEEAIADTQTEATSEFIPLNSGMIDATPGEATPSEAELTEPEPELSEFTPVPGTYTVKLQTYGCLKSLLGIGINSASYEVFYLDNAKDGWTLTARRFGHGVGMSQRGAQTMAGRHGMDCEEILGFYYPGLTLYVIDWTQQSLTPISALPESLGYARPRPTPRPTQAPLPALKAGEYYARVTLQSSASTLNVRSQPNTSCSIVALLYNNERVIVTGSFEDNWVSIKTVEFTGYVKADYLKNE